jgi:hypothetical protein
MNYVHRQFDSRACGATTITRVPNVRVNGRFISIDGDVNNHGSGGLIASETVGKVRAMSIPVIVLNNNANADNLCPGGSHCNPKATTASPNVRAGSGQ